MAENRVYSLWGLEERSLWAVALILFSLNEYHRAPYWQYVYTLRFI